MHLQTWTDKTVKHVIILCDLMDSQFKLFSHHQIYYTALERNQLFVKCIFFKLVINFLLDTP